MLFEEGDAWSRIARLKFRRSIHLDAILVNYLRASAPGKASSTIAESGVPPAALQTGAAYGVR